MSNFIRRTLNFGVTPEMPFRLQNKIRIFNAAAIFIILINIGYSVVGLFIEWYFATLLSVASMLLIGFSWLLIYRKKYTITFHIVMFYAFSFILTYSWLFGQATQSHLFLLFLPVASTILFEEKRTRFFYVGITLLSIIFIRYVYENGKPYYETRQDMLWIFGYLNTCFSAYLIFIGVSLFKKENQGYSDEIELQKQSIEVKNKEITDSINYAGKIQQAIIPTAEEFSSHFSEAFVLLKPKDIVSGDFYWITRKNGSVFFAVADCTGHGVPGGFMTMLGISFLDEIINDKNLEDPALVLDQLREKIIFSLRQTGASGESKDGMDIVLCRFETGTKKLFFAGANNSLYLFRGGKLSEFKNDKQPCGFHHLTAPFNTREIAIESGDLVYLFTDGFPDQFGGFKGKKFKYRQLEEKIAKHHRAPLPEQAKLLDQEFENWKGSFDQVDDVLLVGTKFL